jgi:hypothetical protein
MAKKKTAVTSFLKPVEQSEHKSISVRVPIELHTRFETVKTVAQKHGYTLSLTDVVLNAMDEACDAVKHELREKLGKDVFQGELDV